MYTVLAQTFGTDQIYRLVLVPIWTTAVAANDESCIDNITKEEKE